MKTVYDDPGSTNARANGKTHVEIYKVSKTISQICKQKQRFIKMNNI